MSTAATYDDVSLILKLYELRRDVKMREARDWFAANFKGVKTMEDLNRVAAPGTAENAYARMVTSYWDMVASFITSGVLNPDLFFKSGGEMLFTWFRIEDLVPQLRQAFGNPAVHENLEQVAKQYMDWTEKKAPGAVERWRQMAKG
jgi:hypothetical protein